MINVFGKNNAKISLTDKNFITEGGEGRLYGKDEYVYKINLNPSKVIPSQKIQELSALDEKNIIKPLAHVYDEKKKPVGFYMNWIKNTTPLCKLFANSFRDNNGISPETITKLVESIQNTISFIHSKKCLIVDGNEFNYLIDNKNFTEPYFIDVDSYQTPNYKATAIMPTIQDFQNELFSELTDWYSFGIVSCQLFIGIHPFKGNHPKYGRDLEKRMRANISVFNKDVSIPSTVRDFGHIPSDYLAWYIEIFEKGKRIPPPHVSGFINIIKVDYKLSDKTENFVITLIREMKDDIIGYTYYNGTNSIKTRNNKIWVEKMDYDVKDNTNILFSPDSLTPIFVSIDKGKIKFDSKIKVDELNLYAKEKIIVDNNLYVVYDDKLTEISMDEINGFVFPSVKVSYDILPHSTVPFKNFLVSNVLGKPHFIIPYHDDKEITKCAITYIKELEGYKFVDGRKERNVIVCIANKKGKYNKFIFKFDVAFEGYSVSMIEDVNYDDINFVVLENGVCIMLDEDDEIKMFSNDMSSTAFRVIKDKQINAKMILVSMGRMAGFYINKKLFKLTLKNK